ncbi:probable periplasmic serine endoprotease DegP-like [Oppia nitens]|uniref:probable periplasmic serine endoprotease DegP-like n=1 Tax=Oppia nitens TaxID=1686743 RepID=UPI0023DAE787|nr:probable periplasmic serine endoprotease DegP-like [Oppia nitens]
MNRLSQKIQLKIIINCLLSVGPTYHNYYYYRNRQRFTLTLSQLMAPVCLRKVRMDASVEHIGQLYKDCKPWVVQVIVHNITLLNEQTSHNGTGFIVDSELGLIVTNYHVVSDNPCVTIEFPNNFSEWRFIEGKLSSNADTDTITGKIVYIEPQHDLALIQMRQYVAYSLPNLELSDTVPDVGDEVITIGYPDVHNTIQYGFICSVPHQIDINIGYLFNFDRYSDPNHTYTLHSSPGWPGSSGGPVIDMNGRVIGVHFASLDYKLNIATKLTDVYAFIQKGKHYMNSNLIELLNERQQRFKRPNNLGVILRGFIVQGFTYNAINARDQLEVNDIITAVNETQLTDWRQLTSALDNITDDQNLRLTVMRERRLETGKRILNELNLQIKPQNNINEFYF